MRTITTIENNGSKWGGEKPDNIETLIDVLANHPLDKTFEDYGTFYEPLEPAFCKRLKYPPSTIAFFGNFFNFSHCFSIRTNDIKLIHKLTRAIEANKQRSDYINQ